MVLKIWIVSIPNGDKHDFKHGQWIMFELEREVSIPNGDKHDFKPGVGRRRTGQAGFQSPMGISMISNPGNFRIAARIIARFQSPMGISMISNPLRAVVYYRSVGFNPQWG